MNIFNNSIYNSVSKYDYKTHIPTVKYNIPTYLHKTKSDQNPF